MEYPICKICGAAMADGNKHRRWHEDIEGRMKKAITEAFRDLRRRAMAGVRR